MIETTETPPAIGARKIVEECLEFAKRNGWRMSKTDRIVHSERRATPRTLFTHPVRYCPDSRPSEDHTEPARMLDISLNGIGIWCRETLTGGKLIHLRLPRLDGTTGWVTGRVVYCRPQTEHYQAGIAFIFDQGQT